MTSWGLTHYRRREKNVDSNEQLIQLLFKKIKKKDVISGVLNKSACKIILDLAKI